MSTQGGWVSKFCLSGYWMTPFGIKGLIILIVDHCQNSLIAKILIAESPIAKILTAEWAIAKILTAKCPIAKILIAVILIANIQIAKYPIAKILIAQMLSSPLIYWYNLTIKMHPVHFLWTCTLQTFQSLRTQLLVVFLSQLYTSCTFDI